MSQTAQLAKKPNDLRSIITSDNMKRQFAAALPQHLSADRFCRIAITALTRTPKLAECTQESLMRCLLDLSAYGIEPDGRRAHLIPYKRNFKDDHGKWQSVMEVQLILDWKGLAELAMRSGIIAKLHADIVCENDVFTYNMGEITEHRIDWQKPRGAMYGAYAMAVTKDGPVFVAILTKEEIDGIRKRSKAGDSGPWVTDYNEMAKKTAFRRLAKWLPLSAEFRDAVEKDHDLPPEREVTPVKTARAVPLDPFRKTIPAIEARTEEAAPAPVIDAGEESPQFQESMLQIEQAETPAQLLQAKVLCDEIIDENERTTAKTAVNEQADELGLQWDEETAQFISA